MRKAFLIKISSTLRILTKFLFSTAQKHRFKCFIVQMKNSKNCFLYFLASSFSSENWTKQFKFFSSRLLFVTFMQFVGTLRFINFFFIFLVPEDVRQTMVSSGVMWDLLWLLAKVLTHSNEGQSWTFSILSKILSSYKNRKNTSWDKKLQASMIHCHLNLKLKRKKRVNIDF